VINLEETVIRKLRTAQAILCTVESCTGGLLAHLITNVPGASEVFWGSFIVYDNSAKLGLGVSQQTLNTSGAVSAEAAKELAEMGLNRLQTAPHRDSSYSLLKPKLLISVATTGIAGPSGGTREKPVGLCYIGIAVSGRPTRVEKFQVSETNDRIQTKNQFAQKALELIRSI
jgi:nicotinamide-nucleotide amidase